MTRILSVFALIMLASAGVSRAEPQAGYPAQRERATQVTGTQPRNDPTQKDAVQRREHEISKRDHALTNSICKGC